MQRERVAADAAHAARCARRAQAQRVSQRAVLIFDC